MNELKTLKDFEKFYYVSGGNDADGYLATEDKFSIGEGHLVEIDDLKSEAIKWVKAIGTQIITTMSSPEEFGKTLLKDFFNITEEDLK